MRRIRDQKVGGSVSVARARISNPVSGGQCRLIDLLIKFNQYVWGQASLGRVRHLTRSRPLAGAAAANPRGQARFTHSLAIQPAGQADMCLAPAEL